MAEGGVRATRIIVANAVANNSKVKKLSGDQIAVARKPRRGTLDAGESDGFRSVIDGVLHRNGIKHASLCARSVIFPKPSGGWFPSYLDRELEYGSPITGRLAVNILRLVWLELAEREPVPTGPDVRRILRTERRLAFLARGADGDGLSDAVDQLGIPGGAIPPTALPSFLAQLVLQLEQNKAPTINDIIDAAADMYGANSVRSSSNRVSIVADHVRVVDYLLSSSEFRDSTIPDSTGRFSALNPDFVCATCGHETLDEFVDIVKRDGTITRRECADIFGRRLCVKHYSVDEVADAFVVQRVP